MLQIETGLLGDSICFQFVVLLGAWIMPAIEPFVSAKRAGASKEFLDFLPNRTLAGGFFLLGEGPISRCELSP